ncbi:MAG: nucleoside deaminase [Gemmatimonadaceae bacterium]|nr:nucleoside deaminase [Gemmatimonadaceae bacterium]
MHANTPPHATAVTIVLPSWAESAVDWERRYERDEDKMHVAIALSRINVEQETGGPFGAAVFAPDTGRLVGIGVNSVVRLNSSALHAEVVALMLAEQQVASFSLAAPGLPRHELVTSCEPCAMCLGATLWSGVKRLVCGATRSDATRLGFDEGPVFNASYEYLAHAGIEIAREVCRAEARGVLELYRSRSGPIYNP